MKINKDTQLYCSFSSNPGNLGCEFHNRGFEILGINAIYKSIKVDGIGRAIEAMRTFNILGAGVSMPFKVDALKYVDVISDEAKDIGATNTLVNQDGTITAYNTDYTAAKVAISAFEGDLHILGNGGYSKAVQYTCSQEGREFHLITRDNWDEIYYLKNSLIFNCTPMEKSWVRPHESNVYIDCLVDTYTGQLLSFTQAREQFKLYTGLDYPYAKAAL